MDPADTATFLCEDGATVDVRSHLTHFSCVGGEPIRSEHRRDDLRALTLLQDPAVPAFAQHGSLVADPLRFYEAVRHTGSAHACRAIRNHWMSFLKLEQLFPEPEDPADSSRYDVSGEVPPLVSVIHSWETEVCLRRPQTCEGSHELTSYAGDYADAAIVHLFTALDTMEGMFRYVRLHTNAEYAAPMLELLNTLGIALYGAVRPVHDEQMRAFMTRRRLYERLPKAVLVGFLRRL